MLYYYVKVVEDHICDTRGRMNLNGKKDNDIIFHEIINGIMTQ